MSQFHAGGHIVVTTLLTDVTIPLVCKSLSQHYQLMSQLNQCAHRCHNTTNPYHSSTSGRIVVTTLPADVTTQPMCTVHIAVRTLPTDVTTQPMCTSLSQHYQPISQFHLRSHRCNNTTNYMMLQFKQCAHRFHNTTN